jgi:ABC-type branched-subunit amino acid transport system permease subunit
MRPVLIGALAGVIGVLLLQPLERYPQFVIGQLAILVIIVLGMNMLMGVAGLLSMASSAFVGFGATATAAMMVHAGIPVFVAAPIAVASAWAVGWILGLASLRLAGFYLTVVTLGFLLVFLTVLNEGGDLTGRGFGLILPRTTLPVIGRVEVAHVASASVFLAAMLASMLHSAIRSRVGRAWIASKDNPAAAELQGIHVSAVKTLAFALSSALAALAGTMQALLLGITNPNAYESSVAIQHITYTVVGGVSASIIGAFAGPIVLFLLPELFRQLQEWRELFYGAVLLITLTVAPRGIAGAVADLWRRLRRPQASST